MKGVSVSVGGVGYSWSTIVMIVVAVALIIGVATFIIRKSRLISTPSNITRITQQQQAILEGRYGGYPFSRKGLGDAWTMVENKNKDGVVPSEQRDVEIIGKTVGRRRRLIHRCARCFNRIPGSRSRVRR